MNLRKSCLPQGWYPQNSSKIGAFLDNFAYLNKKATGSEPKNPVNSRIPAAVAPHAGWYYSGDIAARAVSFLAGLPIQCETVAVIGGHLPEGMPALFAMEDGVSVPQGSMEIDSDLRDTFIRNIQNISGLKAAEDRYQDNTVEVLLPMIKYFFPHARLLWLRLPADMVSFKAGKTLAKTAVSLNRKLFVLGSTDLTHYGSNYGFCPNGHGHEALDWVINVNDRRFIDAVEAGDPEAVLERADTEHSSCSPGAVLGVMGFAEEIRSAGSNINSAGKLLSYKTSADVVMEEGEGIPGSFVGYGAFVWS